MQREFLLTPPISSRCQGAYTESFSTGLPELKPSQLERRYPSLQLPSEFPISHRCLPLLLHTPVKKRGLVGELRAWVCRIRDGLHHLPEVNEGFIELPPEVRDRSRLIGRND